MQEYTHTHTQDGLKNNNEGRKNGIDILKCLAAFLIVCIHIPFKGEFGKLVVSVSRCAVPIFFMITGFFYQQKVEKNQENKQIIKVLKLCIMSNLLFFGYTLAISIFKHENIMLNIFNLKNLMKLIFLNESPFAAHLWYLNALLYVLIIMKFINKYNKYKVLYIITPFLLLTDLIFGKYSLLIFGKEFNYLLVRNFLFVGIPYFSIGSFINRKIDYKKCEKYAKYIFLLAVFFALTTILEKLIIVHFNAEPTRDHYISTTFLAISLFLYFLQYKNEKSRILKYVANIGRSYSSIIYIVHPIFINIFDKIFKNISIYSYVAPVIVFACTTIVVVIYKKVKEILLSKMKKEST